MYFVLSFIATAFLWLFVSSVANAMTSSIALLLFTIFLIGLAKWLEFPWVAGNLQNLLEHLQKKKSPEIEPPQD